MEPPAMSLERFEGLISASDVGELLSNILDDLVVLDALVIVDEGFYGTGIDHSFADVLTGECANGIHRLPLCQHQEFNLFIQIPSAEVSTNEARYLPQFRHDVRSEVFGITVGIGLCCASPPFANDHVVPRWLADIETYSPSNFQCQSTRETLSMPPCGAEIFASGTCSQRPDCLADDAVSCEPVSAPNSLLTGKLTGNFARVRPSAAISASSQRVNSMA